MLLDLMFDLSTLPDNTAKEYVLGLCAFHEIQASVIPADLYRVMEKIKEARALIDKTVYDVEDNPIQLGTIVMAKVSALNCPSVMVMAKVIDMHPDGLIIVDAFGDKCRTTTVTVVHGSNALECVNIMGTKSNLEKVVTATDLPPEKILSDWCEKLRGMKITNQQLTILEGRSPQLLLAFHGKNKRDRPIVTYEDKDDEEDDDAKCSCAGSKRKATTSGSSSNKKPNARSGRELPLPEAKYCNHCGFLWPAGSLKISVFATHQNRCKNGETQCKDSRAAGKLATDA